jgi:dCMP deaminase
MMLTAEVWARRSTCARRNVGAVISVNDRIVSHGYNGAPPGEPHCDGNCTLPGGVGCARAVHAEINAINRIPEEFNKSLKILYTTESPCLACASRMLEGPVHNFTHLYYLNEYRTTTGLSLLIKRGVHVIRMTPSGYYLRKTITQDGQLDEMIQ